MSNRNPPENGGHRKPEDSLATAIDQGLGGPKGKAKTVPDGQPVNIPALPHQFLEGDAAKIPERITGFLGWIFLTASGIRLPRKAF